MSCRYHDEQSICDSCPERFGTDGHGFPHPSHRKGRQARRVCHGCGQAYLLDDWNVVDWFHCVECRPRDEAQLSAVPRETERRCVCGNCCCPIGPYVFPHEFTLAARPPRWNQCDAGAPCCKLASDLSVDELRDRYATPRRGQPKGPRRPRRRASTPGSGD